MKRILLMIGAVRFCCALSLSAQQGIANRNVNLRRDPSTASAVLDHLDKGARVTLVDATPDAGFYHVRTEDDQIGWVWSKYVTISEVPTLGAANVTSPSEPQCDASLWSHVYHSQRLIVIKTCTAGARTHFRADK